MQMVAFNRRKSTFAGGVGMQGPDWRKRGERVKKSYSEFARPNTNLMKKYSL
jgi:hypothetical protein